MTEPTKVAIAGDWHGRGAWAELAIEHAARNGADAMIHVGDFGLWTPGYATDKYLDMVSTAVAKAGIAFFWLPGNHEHWPTLPEAGRGKRPWLHHGNLIMLPIGYRWSWWGKRFMAVGGAYSVDRAKRTLGKGYWEEETLTDADVDWACHQPHGMDVILAHDCPTGVAIPGIGGIGKASPDSGFPAIDLVRAEEHRRKMKSIWDKHKPGRWFHGHYHVAHETWYGPTIFTGLDRDGSKMLKNVTFLTSADFYA